MPKDLKTSHKHPLGKTADRIMRLTLANADLRDALAPFAAISLVHDHDPSGEDMIDGPDLSISARMIRAARKALKDC